MTLYLCALRNIRPLSGTSAEPFVSGDCPQVDFTFVKKEKRLAYMSVPDLDCAYSFLERRVFKLAPSVTDFFFWEDKLRWCLGFDAIFCKKISSFALLGKLIDTLLAQDCKILADEFREWDAIVEHESQTDPALYTMFHTLHNALDFTQDRGALWYFECDEDCVDQYLELKKQRRALSI